MGGAGNDGADHDWQRRVADLLYPEEVDEFMCRQAEDEMDVSQIQEERYWNLRTILLRRKGLVARGCGGGR